MSVTSGGTAPNPCEVVGHILEEGSRFGPPELLWGWSITVIVPATPNRTGFLIGPQSSLPHLIDRA
jgi:hypothetical protein